MAKNEASPQTARVMGATQQNQHSQYITLLESMQRETHVKRTLRHLLDFGSITSFDAFNDYGNTRLSATIYILKNTYGVQIASEVESSKNRYGEVTTYVRYRLKEDNNDTVEG